MANAAVGVVEGVCEWLVSVQELGGVCGEDVVGMWEVARGFKICGVAA
jgi:hypothetical protein